MSRRPSFRTIVTWPPPEENNSLATTPVQLQPPAPSPDPSVNLVDGQGGYVPPLERFVANGGPSKNVLIVVAVLAAYYFWTKSEVHRE